MIVVTAEQMREMDRLTIEKYGVPSLTLMERAGEAVTQASLQTLRAQRQERRIDRRRQRQQRRRRFCRRAPAQKKTNSL